MLELYKRIRQRREELEMSQDELARKLGYKSRSSINKIEKGENDIPQSKIVAFAKALNTTPEYLMGWNGSEQNNLSDEQKELINGFGRLNTDGKSLVLNMINQLGGTRAIAGNNINIIGNNVRGNNNIFSNGKGHSFNFTAE